MPTHQFKDPVAKKIVPVNLYNPHAAPDNDRKKYPEMCTYDVPREFDEPRFNAEENFEPRLGLISGGKNYVENNADRFGDPIRPCKPYVNNPAPGIYDKDYQGYPWATGPNPVVTADGSFINPKGQINGYISNLPVQRGIPTIVNQKHPGPAMYKAAKEPNKISFLFNPTERWVQ